VAILAMLDSILVNDRAMLKYLWANGGWLSFNYSLVSPVAVKLSDFSSVLIIESSILTAGRYKSWPGIFLR
jgi:hypothetical protein